MRSSRVPTKTTPPEIAATSAQSPTSKREGVIAMAAASFRYRFSSATRGESVVWASPRSQAADERHDTSVWTLRAPIDWSVGQIREAPEANRSPALSASFRDPSIDDLPAGWECVHS